MKSKSLIDKIFEDASKEPATVRVEITGTPQAVQKSLKHLAKQRGNAKAKVTSKDGPVQTPPEMKKGADSAPPKKEKEAPPKDDDEDED